MTDTVHVVPQGDILNHFTDGRDCLCNPTTEPVKRLDGSVGWVLVHRRLRDGAWRVTTFPPGTGKSAVANTCSPSPPVDNSTTDNDQQPTSVRKLSTDAKGDYPVADMLKRSPLTAVTRGDRHG